MDVSIQDDNVVELTESFRISLERTADLHPMISLVQREGYVNISNDDGESILYIVNMMQKVTKIVVLMKYHFSACRGCNWTRKGGVCGR